jgi:hypothetical protein
MFVVVAPKTPKKDFSCWSLDLLQLISIITYLVSEKWYFSLQLRLGPTDFLMIVPRNDAIFPKLHNIVPTDRYIDVTKHILCVYLLIEFLSRR